MVNLLFNLVNFGLLIFVCRWFFKRHARSAQQEIDEERLRYRRLLAYRAGLRNDVRQARIAAEKQLIVCEDLSAKVAIWRDAYQHEQEIHQHRCEQYHRKAQTAYTLQMRALAQRQANAVLLPKALALVTKELSEAYQDVRVSQNYIEQSLHALKSKVRS